jgi:hypothetical protein
VNVALELWLAVTQQSVPSKWTGRAVPPATAPDSRLLSVQYKGQPITTRSFIHFLILVCICGWFLYAFIDTVPLEER